MSLSPETEEVLRRARLSTAMAPEQRRRLKSRIVARIAAAGTLLVASDAAARGGFALWSGALSTTAKGVTALALVASLGAGGYIATRAVQRAHAPVAQPVHQEPAPARLAEPAEVLEPSAPAVKTSIVPAPAQDAPVKVPSHVAIRARTRRGAHGHPVSDRQGRRRRRPALPVRASRLSARRAHQASMPHRISVKANQ